MLDAIFNWFKDLSNGLSEMESNSLVTLIIIIMLWVVQRLVNRTIIRVQNNLEQRYNWRKTASYSIYTTGTIAIALVWSNHFGDFATFLGLLSAGLAIAFKDPITNVAGWYFIILQKPFKVGDRIEVNDIIGDVVDINLFQFSLIEIGNWVAEEQSTGRIIHMPNARVFNSPLANYNAGLDYIWNEIPILITFESDWRACKEVLIDILNQYAPKVSDKAKRELQESTGKYLINFHYVTPIVYTSGQESGVLLTMRYLCSPKQRRTTASQLWEIVLDTFNSRKDMDFAYPTRRTLVGPGAAKGAED